MFEEVFKSHPEAEEVYSVNGVPFVSENHARNYAHEVGAKVEVHKRKAKAPKGAEGDEGKAKGDEGADKTPKGKANGGAKA